MSKAGMDSSTTTTTSGTYSTLLQNSGSESDLRRQESNLVDERKWKRKLSNRESARRSRMRKQKHIDDLAAQIASLRKENGEIIAGITLATQHCIILDAENSVLRAQLLELNHRLQSLNEIVGGAEAGFLDGGFLDGVVVNPLNLGFFNQVPSIMAATAGDIFHCR